MWNTSFIDPNTAAPLQTLIAIQGFIRQPWKERQPIVSYSYTHGW